VPGDQISSVIAAPVSRHSAKPHMFAQMIERMFPNLPKLEMFAPRRPGGGGMRGEARCDALADNPAAMRIGQPTFCLSALRSPLWAAQRLNDSGRGLVGIESAEFVMME
jgi:hypothetical protein